MHSEALWSWLCALSERVILKALKDQREGVTIPLDPCPDPLEQFRTVDVAQTPFRLAVFILWLKHQPQAFEWFEKILNQHEQLVRDATLKLNLLNLLP